MSNQLVDRLLEIARKRREILEQMRQAIERGDNEAVVQLAARLTGITDEKCHRIDPRLN